MYGKDGEEGIVTQVVIQPEDRLVTHIVVRSKELTDGNLVARETRHPTRGQRSGEERKHYSPAKWAISQSLPAFDPDEFPLAPFTWKAPYPYTAGEVRWSLQEILEAGSQSDSRPEIKPGRRSRGFRTGLWLGRYLSGFSAMKPRFGENMKKILILTADYGYGHRSAANAIAEALQETHGQECRWKLSTHWMIHAPRHSFEKIKMTMTGWSERCQNYINWDTRSANPGWLAT